MSELEVTQGQGEALPESTVTQAVTEPTIEVKTEKSRDEAGKFAKNNPVGEAIRKASEQLKEKQVAAAPIAAPAEEFQIPEHWKPEYKEAFSKVTDAEAKKLTMQIYKDMEAAHTKRSQEFASRAKYAEVIEQRAKGVPPEQVAGFIDYYASLERGFKQNPQKTLEYLAQQAGVDLRKLYGGQQVGTAGEVNNAEEWQDPVEAKLKEIERGVEDRFKTYEQYLYQQNLQKAQAEIDKELAKTNEAGQPLYAHFQKLEPLMVELKNTNLGKSLSFAELYAKAAALDPELSQQLEQEKQAKIKAEWEAARKANVDKARAAATHLNGSAPAKVSTKAKSAAEAVRMAQQQLSTS
jgi:hypothetical protein